MGTLRSSRVFVEWVARPLDLLLELLHLLLKLRHLLFVDFDLLIGIAHNESNIARNRAQRRVYVMGQRGVDREPSTEADRAEMARLLREAVQAIVRNFGNADVGLAGIGTRRGKRGLGENPK